MAIVLLAIAMAAVVAVAAILLLSMVPGLLLDLKRGKREHASEMILSSEEADRLAARVIELEPFWTRFNSVLYTLGSASYLPHEEGMSNRELRSFFPGLHDTILEHFRRLYPQWTVKYRPGAPLPGFHIFRSNYWFTWPVASLHVDRQYEHVDFKPDEEPDYEGTLSFTIALQLPRGGSGLYVWDARADDPDSPLLLLPFHLNRKPLRHIVYRPGAIVTHSGNHFHMIQPSRHYGPREKSRITIQGHALRTKRDNTLWLYW